MNLPNLRTVSVIARDVGQPVARVANILRRERVRPIGRAGRAYVYHGAATGIVREAINAEATKARKEATA